MLQLLLRDEEVDVDRIERLQRYDGGARCEILALIDSPDSKLSVERRTQGLLRNDRLLLRNLRLEPLQIGCRDVELRLADELPVQLGFIACEIGLPQIA